jgi:Ni,Fe-hydrogenase I small subunit
MTPCEGCARKLQEVQAAIVLGGTGWRCVSCGSVGASEKNSSLALALKKKFPDKKMCEIDLTDCPQCHKNEPQTD